MSSLNWPFGKDSLRPTARRWARQMENCIKLLQQIGHKWAHVPAFEFLSLKYLKAKSNVLVSS